MQAGVTLGKGPSGDNGNVANKPRVFFFYQYVAFVVGFNALKKTSKIRLKKCPKTIAHRLGDKNCQVKISENYFFSNYVCFVFFNIASIYKRPKCYW